MRFATMLSLVLLIAGGWVLAGEPPAPPPPLNGGGEEEPAKTEKELRWERIAEILPQVNAAEEMALEDADKVWKTVQEELFALGPKAIPQLESLLPGTDEKGIFRFSRRLNGILGRDNWEASNLIEEVMRRHRWVPEKEKTKRKELLEELREEDSEPAELYSAFVELKWFGVEGLREEYGGAKDKKMRMKIVTMLSLMAGRASLDTVSFFLDLTLDSDLDIRRKAMMSLGALSKAVDDKAWKKLDVMFAEEKAYPMFVGFLRLDPDTDVRMYAARILGNMELKEAAFELCKAVEDPKDRVQAEAVEALRHIGRVKALKNWEDQLRVVKAWCKSNVAKIPGRIGAEKPVRVKKPDRPAIEKWWKPGGDGKGVGIAKGPEAGKPGDPVPPEEPGGEEKPKTPEDLLWETLTGILGKLNTPEDTPIEEVDKTWKSVEKELFAQGPKILEQLQTLLPRRDEIGLVLFSEKLRGILGSDDWEAARLVERVMRRHRWVSEADRAKLNNLLEELLKDDTEIKELSHAFAELDWFGIEGLRREYEGAQDPKMRLKIVKILRLLADLGSLYIVEFLLDLAFDKEVLVRRKALQGLGDLADNAERAEDDAEWVKLHERFRKEKAYKNFVGFLRLDSDTDIRMYAARVLGPMKVKEAAEALHDALDDPEDRVQGEAVEALRLIARGAVKYIKDYEAQVRAVKAWFRSHRSKLPEQIKASKPARGG